jgi:SAM-dependent methyltransferase
MTDVKLPDAPSTERNREPILEQLQRLLAHSRRVLEVGSGTGQHAVYFAPRLPHLRWQTSEREQNLHEVQAWLANSPSDNLPPPLLLDVTGDWPPLRVDTVFTANTLHIMPASTVEEFFAHLPQVLEPGGQLIVYGPVKIAGNYIGPGNAGFDVWLKEQEPLRGIRDLEWLDQLAEAQGLCRTENNFLPANNQLLVWRA